jgi:hypothetical protein
MVVATVDYSGGDSGDSGAVAVAETLMKGGSMVTVVVTVVGQCW